ncbi:MAG: extracellular solute-binding protein [Lachnospiraceae bacterium]|nr:extracellular solute-binding protein [Lachnospiraceae bacterium]
MREKRIRLTGGGVCWLFGNAVALLICIGIFMCLFSGCGKAADGKQGQNSDSTQADPGKVSVNKDSLYRLEKLDGEISMEYVSDMICKNNQVYLFGDVYDQENGNRRSQVILRADVSELVFTEMCRFAPPEAEDDVATGVAGIAMDGEENIYCVMETYGTPTDMGGSGGVVEMPGSDSTWQLVKLDRDGNELWKADIPLAMYTAQIACTDDRVLINTSETVLIYDADGEMIGEVTIPGMNIIYHIAVTVEGQIFANGYMNSTGYQIVEIDGEKGTAGQALEVPWEGFSSGGNLLAGCGYDLLFQNGEKIIGYNMGESQYTEVLNFVNSGIDSGQIHQFLAVGEETILAVMFDQQTWKQELCLLKKVDPELVQDKQTVTLGGFYLGSDMLSDIIAFNQTSDKYLVTVTDYADFNTAAEPEGGLTILNNDIVAGRTPDVMILDNYNMPVDSYIEQGMFEDLYEWIDKDKELNRKDLLANVMEAFTVDGKLYQMPIGFSIGTAAAKTSVVGNREQWTVSEILEVMKNYPDSEAFDLVTRSELLTVCVMYFGDTYLDVRNGTCDFESEEFIELLEWTARFPEEIDYSSLGDDYWMNERSLYRENRVLLYVASIYSFDDMKQTKDYYFGEPITWIGFPTAEGIGSVLMEEGSFAISAKSSCKEGAWELLSCFLSEEYQSDPDHFRLSVRNDVLEALAEKATEPYYYLDENGNRVEYEPTMGINGNEVTIQPLTRKEAKAYLEFIRSVDKTAFYNEELISLILEEAEGFFAGSKTAAETAEVIQRRASLYLAENR